MLGLGCGSVGGVLGYHKGRPGFAQSPTLYKPGMVAHVCDPSTQEVKGKGLKVSVSDHPGLDRELEASLGYMKSYFRERGREEGCRWEAGHSISFSEYTKNSIKSIFLCGLNE